MAYWRIFGKEVILITTMQTIWDWLDGKKTIIGAAIVGLSAFLQQLGTIDPHTAADLTQFGVAVSTIGLGFKLQKLLEK